MNEYAQNTTVSQSTPNERATFIRRTYAHLAGAILAFLLLEAYLVTSPLAEVMVNFINAGRFNWLLLLGGFMGLSWLARGLASGGAASSKQYAGLTLMVIGWAIIFVPLIYIGVYYSSPELLPTAGILTLLLFGGLTAVVFTTRKDFSFLGGILKIGMFIAIGVIGCAIVFGLTLGLLFSAAMVLFASAAILYDTSKIMHHFRNDQYVGASLELFASIALLFWYILNLLMSLNRR